MRLYRVQGNSMYPVLRDNDFVVVKKTKSESLRKGNILVYLGKNGQHIVHRLVKKEKENIFCLKGDGYKLRPEWTNRDLIVGKAVGFIRDCQYKPLSRYIELSSWSVSMFKENVKRLLRRTLGCSIVFGKDSPATSIASGGPGTYEKRP